MNKLSYKNELIKVMKVFLNQQVLMF